MIPKTMKAAVVREFGKLLTIEEIPVKEPKGNEVLVKVVACGVCHSDVHAAHGEWPVKPHMPLVMGHEGIGYVAKLGPSVTSLKVGDIVGVPWLNRACGHCDYCSSGAEPLCGDQDNSGYSVDGSYAEYVIADANYVGRFPDSGFDFYEMAPILCAGVTVYKGIKSSNLKPSNWVAISGIGGLGHLGVQYAKAMGYKVAAIDISDEKLAFAKELGADLLVNASKNDPGEFLQKEVGGVHAIVITAVSHSAFENVHKAIRRGGTITLLGIPDGDIKVPIFDSVLCEYTVRGSLIGNREDLQESIDLAIQGKVKTFVTKSKLEDINDVLDRLEHGKIKGRVVLDISTPV
ncbi:alcohol dehydrogenase AdhP [Flavobacterium sp. LC2016-01]|uniref:alcohol dehydrogenase AdhP n=1 Tax=Flavobacterium sp. LC2016-01 TaxID=2675876 RepID=UPI0012BB09CB|nr:alcohol dehydrogenase AdhP [Flavobacterium sp. LC2016-01]MTH17721.1 alcohol dehydrogenase AdhP [Flavobacterium sp. LC2016-01]